MGIRWLCGVTLVLGISIMSSTVAFALENIETCPGDAKDPYQCTSQWGYTGEDPYDVDRFSTELTNGTKHGCTSFAAFMLALYNEWMPSISTFDSAQYWETDATSRTAAFLSNSPKVGDIAQWNASENLELGHVAYVKSVVPTYGGEILYIIVADDNGGKLVTKQRKLYPGVMAGTIRWPDNFIRFPKLSTGSSGGGGFGNVVMLNALLPSN